MNLIKKLYFKFKYRKNKQKYYVRIYDVLTDEIVSEKHNILYSDLIWYFDILFINTGLYVEIEKG